MAQQTSFKKKKNVEVIWRGFTDIVEPSGPEFTTQQLRGRLLLALREILRIHKIRSFPKEEQKVMNKKVMCIYIYIHDVIKIF